MQGKQLAHARVCMGMQVISALRARDHRQRSVPEKMQIDNDRLWDIKLKLLRMAGEINEFGVWLQTLQRNHGAPNALAVGWCDLKGLLNQ